MEVDNQLYCLKPKNISAKALKLMNFPESSYCLCSEVCIAAHLSACVNYVFIIDNVYDTYATVVLI